MLDARLNADGTACLYTGNRALLWPAGFTARGTPLALYDEHNEIVGVVGWPMLFGGGNIDASLIAGCSGFSHLWVVGGVQQSP